MDKAPPDLVRQPAEVAWRTLALFSVFGLAVGADREEILRWIAENNLSDKLTPRERQFIKSSSPTKQEIVDASWYSERLVVLLWALGKLDEPPAADQQCDTALLQKLLPPFADITVRDFVAGALLRGDQELIATADQLLMLHWHARDGKLKARPPSVPVDIEVIQERHHAINWIIGYDGAPWDEVTTDT